MPSGTVALVNSRLSLVNGTAFVDFSAAGTLTPYIGGKLTVTDSAGKKAVGYIHHNASDDPFVQMTYAASGSSGITVADNDNIDFGTGNFTLVWKGALPDWTPSAVQCLFYKYASYRGYAFYVLTTGKLRFVLFRNDGGAGVGFASTVAPNLDAGTEHEIMVAITRETDTLAGSLVFFVDGVQLGDAVTISAATTETLSNNGILYVSGQPPVRNASILSTVTLFNFAPTAAEVLDMYTNGIPEAWKWGSQTSLITGDDSTFASDTGWWTKGVGVSIADGVAHYINVASPVAGLSRSDYLTQNCYYRITFTISNLTEGGIKPQFGGTSGTSRTANGTYTEDIKCGTYNRNLYLTTVGETSCDIDDVTFYKLGATLALEPEGINTTNWIDSSDNGLDASYPSTGYSVYPDGTGVRITSTRGGTTYDWESVEAGFDFNDSAGYSYTISTPSGGSIYNLTDMIL